MLEWSRLKRLLEKGVECQNVVSFPFSNTRKFTVRGCVGKLEVGVRIGEHNDRRYTARLGPNRAQCFYALCCPPKRYFSNERFNRARQCLLYAGLQFLISLGIIIHSILLACNGFYISFISYILKHLDHLLVYDILVWLSTSLKCCWLLF